MSLVCAAADRLRTQHMRLMLDHASLMLCSGQGSKEPCRRKGRAAQGRAGCVGMSPIVLSGTLDNSDLRKKLRSPVAIRAGPAVQLTSPSAGTVLSAGSSTMTVGERLALQQDRIEEEQRQQMTALQRRQRRRLEYMEVGAGR